MSIRATSDSSFRSHTFQLYVGVRVLLHGRQVGLVLVLVAGLYNVAVGVESRRIALQYVSMIASVFDALNDVTELAWTLSV